MFWGVLSYLSSSEKENWLVFHVDNRISPVHECVSSDIMLSLRNGCVANFVQYCSSLRANKVDLGSSSTHLCWCREIIRLTFLQIIILQQNPDSVGVIF